MLENLLHHSQTLKRFIENENIYEVLTLYTHKNHSKEIIVFKFFVLFCILIVIDNSLLRKSFIRKSLKSMTV